jgi:hypothetical protein
VNSSVLSKGWVFQLELLVKIACPVGGRFFKTRVFVPFYQLRLLRLGGLWAYFNGFGGYSRKNYGFSGNLPFTHVASVCFDGSQPALFDQNLGRVTHVFLVSDNARSELLDFSCGDAGFAPVIYQPVK